MTYTPNQNGRARLRGASCRSKSSWMGTDGMAKVTDAQLGEEVMMAGRRTGHSRGASVIIISSDWADHYSTAAAYLRLNGIVPPTVQPAK